MNKQDEWQLQRKGPDDFNPGDLKSAADTAQLLGISKTTLRKLRQKGLPILRVGKLVKFDVPQTVAWILRNCRQRGGHPRQE